jgi:histidine kinase
VGRYKKRRTALHRSLGFGIALAVGLITAISYSISLYLITGFQKEFFFEQMLREAQTFSSAVLNATNHSMLKADAVATANIVKDLSMREGLSYIRIYNHEGTVKYSDRPSDVGRRVDKKAEACFACHYPDKPFTQVSHDKRTRIYYSPEGTRVLGMITPIYNSPQCSNAACHIHPPDRKVLGVIDVTIPLNGFDALVRSTIDKTALIGALTALMVIVTTAGYVTVKVNRPVARLIGWIKSLTLGEPTNEMPIRSKDEFGELARAFNILNARIQRRTRELEKSREEFRTLFEQVPCFISVIDRNFRIVRQNAKMREYFKGTVGMHCYEVYKRQPYKCQECVVEQTLHDGMTYRRQECGINVSGEEAHYLSYTLPVRDSEGELAYAMAIAIDIGDRVKLEKELQVSIDFQTNLIENSIHGIVATDENGRLNVFNRAAENLFNYSAAAVIGDTEIEKYFPQQFVEMIRSSLAGEKIEPTGLIAQEAIVPSSTGERIPVRFSGVVLYDDSEVAGSVGFFQDLRTFKRLEREKADADRLAVVGQTVAGLAHGIKNVLQGLEGGLYVVETAMEDHDDALLDRGWQMVQNNIRRISALVKDLLSYSKERTPEYEEVDPNALAEEVCALFDLRAQEESIQISREFDPDLDTIVIDQRGIHTALANLVSNAIDACEADSQKHDHLVVVRTGQGSNDSVVFEVSDNGTGMDEEAQKKIFSVFFSTKGSKGTGLGLLVTSKIVQEHEGEISFESSPGVGTTFTINLPRRRTDQASLLKTVRDEEPESDALNT